MTWQEISDYALDYFTENPDDFTLTIEELDGWCGYLDNEHRNYMDSIGDYFIDSSVKDIMQAALSGEDQNGGSFDPDREYFYWGWDYNTLISTDDIDYSEWLTVDFIKKLYCEYIKSKTRNWGFDDIPKSIIDLFDQFYEETGLNDVWYQAT